MLPIKNSEKSVLFRTGALIHVSLDSDKGLNEFDRDDAPPSAAEIGFRG
jgi:hypothetical protein